MSSSAYLNSKKTKLPKYAVDSATGDLTRQGDIPTPGEPGVQGTSPDRKILYAAMLSTAPIALIDALLWDLAGLYAKLPVHKLLGGFRDRVLAYLTETSIPFADTLKSA